MARLGSLYLPFLATDRIARRHRAARPDAADAATAPLVTAERAGQRLVLAATCPRACVLGLAPGLALTQARLLVPGLEVEDADPAGDAAWLDRLALFAARRWTPRAAPSGSDGLWLDLSGVAHLFGGEPAMGRRILGFCARLGMQARFAVAGTLGAAHALARFGGRDLILCPPGGEAEALTALPPAALRLDQAALATARRLGIASIGELMAMPRAPLQRRFGEALPARLDQALGRAAEPFDPVVPVDPPMVRLRFAEPIGGEGLCEAMTEAVVQLAVMLEREGLGARVVQLVAERVDGAEPEVRIGTVRATRDIAHLQRLLAPKLETIDPGFGLEAVRLVAWRVEPLGPQPLSLLGEQGRSKDEAVLIDRLTARLGPRRLYRLSAVESDVPERSVRRFGPLMKVGGWPSWPRPVRLLSPPEPVDQVIALLPDLPPRRFRWRGRLWHVRQADGPERIHGEWWRNRAETDAVRDYFQVEEEGGQRLWLFRRGDGEDSRTGDLRWYVHGVFA